MKNKILTAFTFTFLFTSIAAFAKEDNNLRILYLPNSSSISYNISDAYVSDLYTTSDYTILLCKEGDNIEFSIQTASDYSIINADGDTVFFTNEDFQDGSVSFIMPAEDIILIPDEDNILSDDIYLDAKQELQETEGFEETEVIPEKVFEETEAVSEETEVPATETESGIEETQILPGETEIFEETQTFSEETGAASEKTFEETEVLPGETEVLPETSFEETESSSQEEEDSSNTYFSKEFDFFQETKELSLKETEISEKTGISEEFSVEETEISEETNVLDELPLEETGALKNSVFEKESPVPEEASLPEEDTEIVLDETETSAPAGTAQDAKEGFFEIVLSDGLTCEIEFKDGTMMQGEGNIHISDRNAAMVFVDGENLRENPPSITVEKNGTVLDDFSELVVSYGKSKDRFFIDIRDRADIENTSWILSVKR